MSRIVPIHDLVRSTDPIHRFGVSRPIYRMVCSQAQLESLGLLSWNETQNENVIKVALVETPTNIRPGI
jgi:hypothetical protein